MVLIIKKSINGYWYSVAPKIYRCWNGGGTVKVVFVNNEFNKPSAELVKEVQMYLTLLLIKVKAMV